MGIDAMTTAGIISKYLELESQLDVQQTLIDTAQAHYDDLMAAQAELATQHLDELSPLRDGQIIELIQQRKRVQINEVQMLIVDAETQRPEIAAHCTSLSLHDTIRGHGTKQLSLDLQPGNQWRYPTDSTAAAAAAPQEVRS